MRYYSNKLIFASVAGNILEIYESIIYGYFASTLGFLFFPSQDRYFSLFASFMVFASGGLVRPFSALFFGYIGDKVGRRFSLILSIGLMSISTLGIGLLPSYYQIGIIAPIMLLLFRLCQGISLAGEQIGAALMLMESAPEKEKGYATSLIPGSMYIGFLGGAMISAFVLSVVSEPALSSWGWRVPFLLGGIIGLITLVIRIMQPESFEFKKVLSNKMLVTNPLLELFKKNKLSLFKMILLSSSFPVALYLFAVYIPNTLKFFHAADYKVMLVCSMGCLIAFIMCLFIGKLIDKIGSKVPILVSSIGFLLFSYPIFYWLSSPSLKVIMLIYGIYALILGIMSGSLMYTVIKRFPIEVRFSGSCIVLNFSVSLFGGTAPIFALYFTHITHDPAAPAFLLMSTALLTSFIVLFEHEKKEKI